MIQPTAYLFTVVPRSRGCPERQFRDAAEYRLLPIAGLTRSMTLSAGGNESCLLSAQAFGGHARSGLTSCLCGNIEQVNGPWVWAGGRAGSLPDGSAGGHLCEGVLGMPKR
jgi:hypothetical protein